MNCATCGKPIVDEYFTSRRRALIFKIFDDDFENVFCSKDCFCEAMELEEVCVGERVKEEPTQPPFSSPQEEERRIELIRRFVDAVKIFAKSLYG